MPHDLFPDDFTLIHNPRCSKSRAAKALLEERGVPFRERLYLDDPLTASELGELAKRLGTPCSEWVRRNESVYQEAGLGAGSTDKALLAAMARHPILIERPILIGRKCAVVGRPPERILALLE
jgi:arsenate reductase